MSTDALYPEPGGEETTGGWSGSETSHERAVEAERSGRASRVRDAAWEVVRLGGLQGATWYEVSAALHCHHGSASSALSNLHMMGKVERLRERRGRSAIYVLPHAVNGRETAPFGRRKPAVDATGPDLQTLLSEARNEGYTAGRMEGLELGEEAGWQAGYDAGVIEAAADDDQVSAARNDGIAEGTRRTKERATRVISEMHRLASQHQPMSVHNDRCWMEHPVCALRAAGKAVASA